MNVGKKMGLYLVGVGALALMVAYCGTASAGPVIVTPPGKADLTISSISIGIVTSTVDRDYVMKATVVVKNAGKRSASGAYLDVWNDSTSTESCGATGDDRSSISTLAAGASETFTFTFTNASGSYNYHAFADSQCVVAESCETNNQSDKAYTIH